MDHSDVVIQHMTLSGATHHREALLQSLDAQSWPGEDDEKLLVIRRIDVRGPWWKLSADAVAIARQMAASAVHISQPGAQTADVVYFRHRAEQMVYFCLDLLRNTYQHWYWQTYIGSASTPTVMLRNLFQENLFDLPDIFFQLNRAQCFPALIKMLGADNVRDIHRDLCTVTQWNNPPAIASENRGLPQEHLSSEAQRIIAEWAATLVAIKRDTSDGGAVISLVALICAWKIYPHKLRDQGFSVRWEDWFRGCIYGDKKSADELYAPQQNTQLDKADEDYIVANNLENYENGYDTNIVGHSQQIFPLDISPINTLPADTKLSPMLLNDYTEANALTDTHIYQTQYGGIFFLINALLLAKCTDDIQQSRVVPWELIQHMANMLGCGTDSGLTEFLENQLTMSEEEGALLPASHLAEKLTPQVIYRFNQHLQWDADFFLLRARIEQRLPYINVYFHMSSIQLPLRVLGLDINPGWQPWLGQVIKYHYVTDPDLLPLNSLREQNP